jgi:TonB family protein
MLGAQDKRRARKAINMKTNLTKLFLISSTAILVSLLGFDCCSTNCLKRTIEWVNYTPTEFEDNQEIINSENFKTLQKKHQIDASKIDSFWITMSPLFIKWISSYDSIFQGDNKLIIKFRLNSTGKMENLRVLNTFPVDTNRINILKNNVKNIRFEVSQDSTIAIEFTVNVKRDGKFISTNRNGPIYCIKRGRSREEIMNAVNSSLKPMKQTFQSELNKNMCAHGKITVRFVLREDGTIPKCQIVESSYCDSTFENQIVMLVSNWKFPAMLSTYDLTGIVYPFVFNRE